MYFFILPSRSLDSYVSQGLLGSVVLHILLGLIALSSSWHHQAVPSIAPGTVVDVSFEPPRDTRAAPADATRQIVTPPDSSTDSEPSGPTFLSDRDASTNTPQIKRGDDPNAGVKPSEASSEPAPRQPPQNQAQPPRAKAPAAANQNDSVKTSSQVKPASRVPLLALDEMTLLREFAQAPTPSSTDRLSAALSGQGEPTDEAIASTAAITPFSRAPGSGARIVGARGSTDFLPTLPDGDLTLLNTKASVHAVFVRRVAIQVFSNLRASGWEQLRASDVRAMTEETTVRAVLSPTGRLLRASLERSSGSPRFDEVLEAAVRRGARDPNPPKAAALKDGNIHFIFKARSWVMTGSDPRTGAPRERRWLVLGTGLE